MVTEWHDRDHWTPATGRDPDNQFQQCFSVAVSYGGWELASLEETKVDPSLTAFLTGQPLLFI